jgi:hypothetical protein
MRVYLRTPVGLRRYVLFAPRVAWKLSSTPGRNEFRADAKSLEQLAGEADENYRPTDMQRQPGSP